LAVLILTDVLVSLSLQRSALRRVMVWVVHWIVTSPPPPVRTAEEPAARAPADLVVPSNVIVGVTATAFAGARVAASAIATETTTSLFMRRPLVDGGVVPRRTEEL
jgi:hypothetical protein